MSKCKALLNGCHAALLVLALAFFLGCGHEDDHDHGDGAKEGEEAHQHEKGPHGGPLLVVGDEAAHVELLHDEAAGKVTLYIFGPDPKSPLALAEAPMLNLVTKEGNKQIPSTGVDAGEGGASRFEAVDEALKAEELEGRIALSLMGKPYSVNLEEAHDH